MRVWGSLIAALIVASPVYALDWRGESWTGGCRGDPSCSDFMRDWPKALNGDPIAQKNMTYYFAREGRGVARADPEFACAWEIVLLASGHREVYPSENMNLRTYCGRPLVNLDRPRSLADDLFRKIYRKPLPPPPWEVLDPVDKARLPGAKEDFSRMVISAQILIGVCPGAKLDAPRMNAMAQRMGIKNQEISEGGSLYRVMLEHGRTLEALMNMTPRDPRKDCKSLDASYGRNGQVLSGIAILPVPDDYPN